MKIHTVKKGDTIGKIAEEYGITEEHLREINGIVRTDVTVGEDLLILCPTRTHTARSDDTIERICLRYRIRKSDILALNPKIDGEKIKAGKTIVLKYDERTHGMAVTNGYIYKGCSEDDLKRALPFMTYATFVCRTKKGNALDPIFCEDALLETVLQNGKIPLIKVYGDSEFNEKNEDEALSFYDSVIKHAKEKGYRGIVLNSVPYSNSAEFYSSLLMKLRKRMIGSDLILITECDDKTPIIFNDLSDGSVLTYSKLWDSNIPSFDDGEKKIISDFACEGESTKTFIELPAFARLGNSFIDITHARALARASRAEIRTSDETLLSEFETPKGKCYYPSLKNEKAVLELLSKYGYMGMSFDVMRTPTAYIMMYNAMFKTVNHPA